MIDFPAPLPADVTAPDDLLQVLLEVSLTGVILFRPLYVADGAEISDFAYELLNPAAQQMLQLPVRPAESFLTRYPGALTTGIFAFYQRAFLSDKLAHFARNYQQDSLDGYFQLAARRHGPLLVVSFTDTNDQPRTAVEEALRQSQAREQQARGEAELQRAQLQSVFEQAPAMICIFEGPQHHFQFVNGPYQALVGERPLVGQPIAVAMPELVGQPIFDLLDGVYRTGETFYATEMLVQLDHENSHPTKLEERFYNFIYQARRNLRGDIDGILVFSYEVTPQVQARRVVEATAQQLASLNQELDQLNEELAAANEELQAANEDFLSANASLAETQRELQYLNIDLESRVTQRTAESVAALREAQDQREQLQVQQGLLRRILGQVPAAIATLTGAEHRYTFFNDEYQVLAAGRTEFGHTVAEVMPEAVDQGFVELLDQVYTTGQPFVGSDMPAKLYNAATGQAEQRYVDFIYQPLFDDHDQIQGILAFILDVTDKVLARQQVQELNKELHTTNEELGSANYRLTRTNADLDTFVYSASHDLKSPITNIEGLLLALRQQLPAEALRAELVPRLLAMMDGAVARFQQTLTHLTDVSRLQQALEQPAEAVALAALVEAVRLDILPELTAAGATLTVDLDGCPSVHFSAKNLRSIIYNLLSNAVKYRASDRPARVALRCRPHPGHVVLEVQDNGLGLNEAQQQELFRMFRRLHSHVEGSGVGLYMVKKMVENAGGTITLQSQPGVGTTFTVSLPDEK